MEPKSPQKTWGAHAGVAGSILKIKEASKWQEPFLVVPDAQTDRPSVYPLRFSRWRIGDGWEATDTSPSHFFLLLTRHTSQTSSQVRSYSQRLCDRERSPEIKDFLLFDPFRPP